MGKKYYLFCCLFPCEYLIYFPLSGEAKINMQNISGAFSVEWFIPLMHRGVPGPRAKVAAIEPLNRRRH